jgi:hypothetical protein
MASNPIKDQQKARRSPAIAGFLNVRGQIFRQPLGERGDQYAITGWRLAL